jgi:hypothetical protein
MYAKVMTVLSDFLGSKSKMFWNENNNGLRMYFQSEYKKDAEWAYEYWISTGNTNYRNS